jgi:predicted ATPase
MKIISFEVVGLFDRSNVSAMLNADLNILTGKNGAGKTTILKLLWYVVSGNIELALDEIPFKKLTLVTDLYSIIIHAINRNTCKIELTYNGEVYEFEDVFNHDEESFSSAEDQANPILIGTGSSIFFPTFRRIEGGFTLAAKRTVSGVVSSRAVKNDVEIALAALSNKISNGQHRFISAMSTSDVVNLVLRQYSDLSEQSNELQQQMSQGIIETIKEYKTDRPNGDKIIAAENILDEIRSRMEKVDKEREKIMTPIDEVKKLVAKLFQHSGINLNNRLSFGEAANSINSDALSAGEKQMLSFICYNAFYEDCIIFIDEPELSLHVDWQRQLFPILQRQQSSNQFIIATHSPFIYSKYPDKEVSIDPNRGDQGAE